MAFSIMCMFLTVLYASFAALTFAFSKDVLTEMSADYSDNYDPPEASAFAVSSSIRNKGTSHFLGAGYDGYIGERFDVRPANASGFVAPTHPSDGTLT